MRQIVLDTETTGLELTQGHRIIEIGCVELVNRRHTGRHFHHYLNPDREIDAGALAVHGIAREKLAEAPRFAQIASALVEFIAGAELIIHNAAFDLAFLDMELTRLAREAASTNGSLPSSVSAVCSVLDTLLLARERHPGQRNNLDALCKRYGVDNSNRDLHGALLDARLLADVYLAMTGGQSVLAFEELTSSREGALGVPASTVSGTLDVSPPLAIELPQPLRVIEASALELATHAQLTALLEKSSRGRCIWMRLEAQRAETGTASAQSETADAQPEGEREVPAAFLLEAGSSPQALAVGGA